MKRHGVRVIIRTRPTANFAAHQLQIDPDDSTITVRTGAAGGSSSSPTKNGAESSASSISTGPSNRKDCWTFKFHQVLHNAGQDRVYEAIARDIVHGVTVDGVNGTILAYGQTGAGKSFTMIGDTRNYAHRGIAPRAIAQVFEEVENRIELSYTIRVSYMEIYNDRIYDLLAEDLNGPGGELVVVDDAKGTSVRGLTLIDVANEQEALDCLFKGELQRTVAEHQLNKRSNRSHCIFTLHMAQKSRAGGNERVTHSKLHLVDLAGSERLKKTLMDEHQGNNSGSGVAVIKKESMYINQSLSFLEQCIVALGARSSEPRHIPYRQTKLTNVLKDSLGGNSNTLMFACIWGEAKHLEETISTLKLAQRMMRVQNEITAVVETDPAILLRKYEKQIRELKQELAMHDALVERTGVVYDEHTPEQKHRLMQMVSQYVDATTNEKEDEALKFSSLHDIRELFRQFKILLKHAEAGAHHDGAIGNGGHGSARTGSAGSRSQSSNASRTDIHGLGDGISGGDPSMLDDVVGEDVPGAVGFGLGIVAGAARPSTVDANRRSQGAGAATSVGTAANTVSGASGDRGRNNKSPSPGRGTNESGLGDSNLMGGSNASSRTNLGLALTDSGVSPKGTGATTDADALRRQNEAFQIFKSTGAGRKLHQNLLEEKDKLFDARQRVKQVSNRVNGAKAQIDHARTKLEDKRSQRGQSSSTSPGKNQQQSSLLMSDREEVVDEEEFLLMTAEREAKREYRSLFGDLKEVRAELEFTTRSVELLRMRIVREFEDWFDSEGGRLTAAGVLSGIGASSGLSASGSSGMLSTCSRDDKLDDGEQFDQMEIDRIRAQDPDSLAFFQAQKKMRHHQATTGGSSPTSPGKLGRRARRV